MSEDPNRETRSVDPFATPRSEPSDASWAQDPGAGSSSASSGYGPPTSYPDPYSSGATPTYDGGPTHGTQGYGTQGYGGPGYGAYPPYPGQAGPYAPYGPVATTNGMAVASLVCGLLGVVFWFPCVLALIFGYIGKRQIRERGESGDGMATAGLVLGWMGVAFFVLFVLFIVAAAASHG